MEKDSVSLPADTIAILREENDRLKAEVERSMFVDYWGEKYSDALKQMEKLKQANDTLELALQTLKRRVISLEQDRN